MAERQGFEPREVLPSTVFKTAAIDHSAISPIASKKVLLSKAVQRYGFILILQIYWEFFCSNLSEYYFCGRNQPSHGEVCARQQLSAKSLRLNEVRTGELPPAPSTGVSTTGIIKNVNTV